MSQNLIQNENDLRAPEKRFRPEIEGVRAVAALLVAIYHIWLGSVSGGVDVFFIVSGYLITTSLLSRMVKYGRINFLEYVLGLARRLFPIAFIVILFISTASIFIMPLAQWGQTMKEMVASALYFQNWQLAFSSVDYLAQNNSASPFQHFWALSLQGQFYITWPLVIFLSYLLAMKVFKTPVRKTLLAVLSILFILSFSYSIYITEVNQPWAYFNTFARAWEFSLGGILSLLLPYIKLPQKLSVLLGWAGLLVICFTGVILPVSNSFPGYVALLPITGVMLVIISAESSTSFGVDKLLGSKPFLYFGSISYGFYLWHWPLLIFYYTYFGKDTAPFFVGVMIILITVVLSIVSVKIIETPIRSINVRQSKVKLSAVLTAIVTPVIIVYAFWGGYAEQAQANLADSYTYDDYPGAAAIYADAKVPSGEEPISMLPDSESNLPEFYSNKDCYSGYKQSAVKQCSYGQTENPDHVVALVGGSHVGHWFPALDKLSEELNMQLDIYVKDGCRFTTGDFDGAMNESCLKWNEEVVNVLKENQPDLIFGTATVNDMEKVPKGYIEQWNKFEGETDVFAVRDNPRMAESIPECVQTKSIEECSIPSEKGLSDVVPWEETAGIPDNVSFADLSDYFCDEDTCSSVIGNVYVYRDQHHLSNLYSYTLAEPLKEPLKKALDNVN